MRKSKFVPARVFRIRAPRNSVSRFTTRCAPRAVQDALDSAHGGTKPAFSTNRLGQFGEAPTNESALPLPGCFYRWTWGPRNLAFANVKGDIRP